MKKPILKFLVLISLFVMASCGPKDKPVLESEKAASVEPVTQKVSANVTDDSLRVRSGPYLDAEIVGHLMTGDRISVETRTEWSQIIGDMDSPWFFVRADGYSGWTYGGFLDFGDASSGSVVFDPGLPPPSADGPGDSAAVQEVGIIDHAGLPEILLPVFGLEEEPIVSDPNEGVITYDSFHEMLVLPFSDSPDSKLKLFASGERNSRLRIVAEPPGSNGFEQEYYLEDCQLLSETSPTPFKKSYDFKDALLLPFFNLATLEPGLWEIYGFLDEETWPVAVGQIEISPSEVTIVAVPEPDPMKHSPRSTYSRGDTVYAFGNSDTGNGGLQLALYNDSGEYSNGKLLLRPVLAYQVNIDSSGYWEAEFLLGDDLPEGKYWAAVGNPIEGLENLRLFITSVDLKRQK